MVNSNPSTPIENTVGPLRPNSSLPAIERIQTMRPTAVMNADVAPTAGQGLGFTR